MVTVTRGIRNRNPFNIRRGSKWKGLCDKQTDDQFCQFEQISYAVRAFLILMRTYVTKRNVRTLRQFVNRYAPASDGNNVETYCAYVLNDLRTRMHFDVPLDVPFLDVVFCSKAALKRYSALAYVFLSSVARLESRYEVSYDMFMDVVNNEL